MHLKSYLTHRNIFVFGLVLLAVGIPVSRFLVSVSQIVLCCNWLLEANFISKWNTLKHSRIFWAFVGIYLFYIAGLLWTEDYNYATKDLRIKLPMLWLPILFFTSPQLNKKEYHSILHFFVAATVVASFWSVAVYAGITPIKIHDIRDISRFESHIRFSLMIVLAALYLFFVLLDKNIGRHKLIYTAVLTWLLCFLVLLQSFTGIIIIGIVGFTALSWLLFSKNSILIKIVFTLLVLGSVSYMGYIVSDEWKRYNEKISVDLKTLPVFSQQGQYYSYDTTSKFTENGTRVWFYIAGEELKKQWNAKSWCKFDSLDFKGNPVKHTLIRYLASKGLRKDSVGLSKLTKQDIENIEHGFPNYRYTNTVSLRTRIHEFIWELGQAAAGEDPTGHSLSMRYEFWKTSWHIIKKHPLTGVGTGDLEQALKEQYKEDKTTLNPKWQLHSHNQFLAVGIALGFTGLLLFIISQFGPFIFRKKRSRFFVFFLLIQFLSFFNEDTLETQAGVTFCVFFTQLLFHNDEYNL
ncbi:MAG: O-antigen ligase family protein [Bacteroidia bacterium]